MHFRPILVGLVAAPPLISASNLAFREAGAGCGPSAGNAVCADSLCCSKDGVCGKGYNYCYAPACQLSFGPGCDGNQIPTGLDTSAVPRSLFGTVKTGVINNCSVTGKVALTFDDGPNTFTNDLLDLLKQNGAKATFFVTGNNAGKGQIEDPNTGFPATIHRMVTEGHQIASHTWSHQDLSNSTAEQWHDQIIRNEIALNEVLGAFPTYFRAPYSRWTPEILDGLTQLGYRLVNYDLDTHDWEDDTKFAQDNWSRHMKANTSTSTSYLAVAHDIDKTVHGFLQFMIDEAKKANYDLVTVGDCLGDPAENWMRNGTTGQPYNVNNIKAVQAKPKSMAAEGKSWNYVLAMTMFIVALSGL